jgi:hypothetical protein
MLYFNFVNILWTAPIQLVLIVSLMVYQIGPSALAGVGLLVLMAPIQGLLFKRLAAVRKTIAPITDKRVSTNYSLI